MYAQALVKPQIFASGKMVLKLGFVLMAAAVFSTMGMPLNAYDSGEILKGYIQEKTMYEKSNDNALFLLQDNWRSELEMKYGENGIKEIEKGVVYVPMYVNVGARKVRINIIEINRKINPDIEIIPQTATEKMHSKSKITGIASKNNALIAVNGGYFKQDTGTPLGALVINNEIISGPIYERAGFGISEEGFKTSRIKFSGEIKSKNSVVKINNINQPRMSANYVLMYTSKWGERAPVTSKPSVYIAVKNNKIIAKSNQPLAIEKDGCVISAPVGTFKHFSKGDSVELNYGLNPEWKDIQHIISGGPYLMKYGDIYVDTESEKLAGISGRNPRTAIGYTRDNVMIMLTVDGRKEGSSGVTLQELAVLMKKLGCYEAINLDGGSSTVMYVDGKLHTGSNIRGSAAISNAILVRNKIS